MNAAYSKRQIKATCLISVASLVDIPSSYAPEMMLAKMHVFNI